MSTGKQIPRPVKSRPQRIGNSSTSPDPAAAAHVVVPRRHKFVLASIPPGPLVRVEGLLAVSKPIDWTSQDVVAYVRGILAREARDRGHRPANPGARGAAKKRIIKVGHGGTLDPQATGVLVIGVGSGTKDLQR